MKLSKLLPKKALNKAFLKVKPNRADIEVFKAQLVALLDHANDTESEEFHKNLIADFLKNTYYAPHYFINTKGRNDLVIHTGDTAKSSVGVIIETKKPTNKAEMLTQQKINVKAFHELVLYYLRERISLKNLEITHLIATNIYEWFIFDANFFEKAFAQNKQLVKRFQDFETGRLSGKTTDFFYKEIAESAIAGLAAEIPFTYVDLREYEAPLRNDNSQDEHKLIALFKLLSPEHLLKLPFANDSNTLDKGFYSELLHIIGLTETRIGNKRLIERQPEGQRNPGSLLENAIVQLDTLDKIRRLDRPGQFGETYQERLFNVGLDLVITWINRILFLKLLEAQLLSYHNSNDDYAFLNLVRIKDFDDLNSLFFQVLARSPKERISDVKNVFSKIPYLNSSLFEPTELEHQAIFISNLKDDKTLPLYPSTVLKDEHGKRRNSELNTLEYIFTFLDAYDFASEGSEEIQEENKSLINASVLGLIFEKINGYKDGSFFTPGFITMYMCRETLRRAVVQKFNAQKHWTCKNLDDVYDQIEDRKEANEILNSLKICDPAVGSGHFLVSALNEIIAIKSDLKILQDREGRRLKEYHVEVVNDELIVTDEEGELFEYKPANKESQRVQVALFHEKQTIIENCLFGVDINPNSVKICRLRLWIELLKNAYYNAEGELETLPNIDINIKCGNSLISRFALNADLKQALRKNQWNITTYRNAVHTYREAESKDEKRNMEQLIADIKNNFRAEIGNNDPKVKRLSRLEGELFTLQNQQVLFGETKKEKKEKQQKLEKLEQAIQKLNAEIEEIRHNKIYENAFEWRFEFPEVLNDNGDFVGFDVVIGNPPYIVIKGGRYTGYEFSTAAISYLKSHYIVGQQQINTYTLFIELSQKISRNLCAQIVPNTFLANDYSIKLREFILSEFIVLEISNVGMVFEDANVETAIIIYSKTHYDQMFKTSTDLKNFQEISLDEITSITSDKKFLVGVSTSELPILLKLSKFDKIGEVAKVWRGLTTGNDKKYIHRTSNNGEYKPLLTGKEIFRYYHKPVSKYVNYLPGELDRARDERIFLLPKKLISKFVGSKLTFCIDEKQHYVVNTGCMLEILKTDEYEYEFLLGILNSKLLTFYFSRVFTDYRDTFPIMKSGNIENLPIVPQTSSKIVPIVVEIVDIKRQDPNVDTSSMEREIDQAVYRMYHLSKEEIQIVEAAG